MSGYGTRSAITKAFSDLRTLIEIERFKLEEIDFFLTDKIIDSLNSAEIICVESAEPEGAVEPDFFSHLLSNKTDAEIVNLFSERLCHILSSHPAFRNLDPSALSELVRKYARETSFENVTLNSFNSSLADYIACHHGQDDITSIVVFIEIAVREATGQGGRLENDCFDPALVARNAKLIVRSLVTASKHADRTDVSRQMVA